MKFFKSWTLLQCNGSLNSDTCFDLIDILFEIWSTGTKIPRGELPYEEYMGVCHELGLYFQEKIPKRVCQFFTKIPERAIIFVRISR